MWEWLKRRFRIYDLLGEYFATIRRTWVDVAWGAGVPAVLFIVVWSLGFELPRWAIALFFVWALFVAGYFSWREARVRLLPKLELGDVCIVKTPTNQAGVERVFVQVLVKCATDADLAECRGHLLRVLKWSDPDSRWTPTEVNEPLELLWSNIDVPVRSLQSGLDQRLDIFFVDNRGRHITIWAVAVQFRMSAVFQTADPGDIFRFDILVTAKDSPGVSVSLRVMLGEHWDRPNVERIQQ